MVIFQRFNRRRQMTEERVRPPAPGEGFLHRGHVGQVQSRVLHAPEGKGFRGHKAGVLRTANEVFFQEIIGDGFDDIQIGVGVKRFHLEGAGGAFQAHERALLLRESEDHAAHVALSVQIAVNVLHVENEGGAGHGGRLDASDLPEGRDGLGHRHEARVRSADGVFLGGFGEVLGDPMDRLFPQGGQIGPLGGGGGQTRVKRSPARWGRGGRFAPLEAGGPPSILPEIAFRGVARRDVGEKIERGQPGSKGPRHERPRGMAWRHRRPVFTGPLIV